MANDEIDVVADDKGWVKTHRICMATSIWKSKEPYDERSAYIELTLRANYKDSSFQSRQNKKKIVVHKNQIFTSCASLASRWKWNVKRVRRYLKRLEDDHMIVVNSFESGTLITIVEYSKTGNWGSTDGSTDGSTGGISDGSTDGRTDGSRLKKGKNSKESQEEQKPKNTAKRSGFDWGNLE